jgi:hypothetical protein
VIQTTPASAAKRRFKDVSLLSVYSRRRKQNGELLGVDRSETDTEIKRKGLCPRKKERKFKEAHK